MRDEGLVPLPRDQWEARRCGPHHVAIGAHTKGGAIHWTKLPLLDSHPLDDPSAQPATANSRPGLATVRVIYETFATSDGDVDL